MPRKDYNAKLDADNAAVLERSRNRRDIAPEYPPPGDLATREACEADFRRFCEHYFPAAFPLKWSDDHLYVLDRMQEVALEGGLFSLAMPRGAGKTTIVIKAALWALLYGHRRFVCLVGATERHAKNLLKQFKSDLTFNDRLAADFRQVCYPLIRLENNGRKAIGQLFNGEQTQIEWGKDRLTFPIMPPEACDGVDVSGSTISVAGLTGALRGQSTALPSGAIIRPELVILDDPQTRESANSPSQSEQRAAIIQGDVLGMAGPGQKIAAIMPCTVIRESDMADVMLDRKKNPEWTGRKTRMVIAFPKNEELWDRYRDIRDASLEAEGDGSEATEFYREHREVMDEGAIVSWPERFNEDELSAIQHAMNLKFRNLFAFQAEYQNDPVPNVEAPDGILAADQVAAKVNAYERGLVPLACTRMTSFIDIHEDVLYYVVAGWEDDFSGYVVDYGTFPGQKVGYFAKREARYTLERMYPSMGVEGRVYAGLEALTESILGREWRRDDGVVMNVDRCPIDANYGKLTDLIYKFCRESRFSGIITPSHGAGIKASGHPLIDRPKKPGERWGLNWYMPIDMSGKRLVRKVIFDANFWKSFVHARLAVSMGDRGCLSLFGGKTANHRLFADHLTAEYPVPVERVGSSRVVDEWIARPERFDNHWFDCAVGCAVAASMLGVALPEATAARGSGGGRARMSIKEMRARASGSKT